MGRTDRSGWGQECAEGGTRGEGWRWENASRLWEVRQEDSLWRDGRSLRETHSPRAPSEGGLERERASKVLEDLEEPPSFREQDSKAQRGGAPHPGYTGDLA